jgi:hypothetical protein
MNMQTNTAVKLETQPSPDRQQLESALNNWRECYLRFPRDQMIEANREAQAAESGLAIAHRNPGEVGEDVICQLWGKLNETSDRLFRLAQLSDRIQEMNLPDLITLFSCTEKLNTYQWEGDAWQLPKSIF